MNRGNIAQIASNIDKKNVFSIANEKISFIENKLTIEKTPNYYKPDCFKPLCIKSDKEISYLIMKIDNIYIFKLPLSFCNKLLNRPDKVNDYYLYFIPWNKFNLEELPIISLHQDIQFIIKSESICNADLYFENIYYEKKKRIELSQKQYEIFVRQYQEQNAQIKNNESINLIFNGDINGIFLDNINISQIKSIKLLLAGYVKINYDKSMIDLFTKNIFDNCIYIPFDNKDYNDILLGGSSINFDRLDNIKIVFETENNNIQNIKIRTFNHNLLIIKNNMAKILNGLVDQSDNM